MCHSQAQIEKSAHEISEVIADYKTRHLWDCNYAEGYLVKEMSENISIHYIKTKKVAVVASRDQYLVISLQTIKAEDSPSGKKRMIVGARSKDIDEYPPKDGIVRASSFITGWYLEEIRPNVCDVHFMIETDYKLSLFLQK